MSERRIAAAVLLAITLAIGAVACAQPAGAPAMAPARAPDVPYEPSPPDVVEAMLDLADVGPRDIVYDLGSGDGRIVIAAARRGAARAVGIDIDPQRIAEANANARQAGLQDRVTFVQGDLFEANFKDATVVTLFLWPGVNMKLRPQLLALAPGTRIVSHLHDLGDWRPDRTRVIRAKGENRERTLYLWVVPRR
jgi:SAM-dependent methyltransferase